MTTPVFGWLNQPKEVARIKSTLPMPDFATAAPHLRGSGAGMDVVFWDCEQKVLGKILPAWDQGQIGSCVSHGWGRAVQDLLLVQIAQGASEEWHGEVAREPIYGGSRVEVGGERGSMEDGSVGAWAAKWVNLWGIILYAPDGLSGYYDVNRCKQWGAQGVPANYEDMAKKHPVKTVSAVMSPEAARDAICNGYPVAICGDVSRTMQRRPGGWCPKVGNDWPHCQELTGHVVVGGGGQSPWGGDGAAPFAGDVPALIYRNSWADYLGSTNNQVSLASGRTITLPQGCYLSTYAEVAPDLRQGDSFSASHTMGWAAQTLTWLI